MNYIKYENLGVIFYVLDKLLINVNFTKLTLIEQINLADIVIQNNELVKCRYSIESLIDYFCGINTNE